MKNKLSSFALILPIGLLFRAIVPKWFQFISISTNFLTYNSISVKFAINCLFLWDYVMKYRNNVKRIREERLMSKAELARLAGVSPATIDRIERGEECRMETKRKILLALGFSLSEREQVFLN